MKAARALAHDLDAIEHIHRQHPLDLEALVARYYESRTQVTRPIAAPPMPVTVIGFRSSRSRARKNFSNSIGG